MYLSGPFTLNCLTVLAEFAAKYFYIGSHSIRIYRYGKEHFVLVSLFILAFMPYIHILTHSAPVPPFGLVSLAFTLFDFARCEIARGPNMVGVMKQYSKEYAEAIDKSPGGPSSA
ncbi:hypothetical protein F5B18DRAFT_600456 [Nemania serpens]|nr:hypothetical protein F5B18DRAFT_600456 [Nemania serpens]